MASNGNNTILWLLGGAAAAWLLFLRKDDEEPEQFPDLHHPVKHSWADTLTGRAMRMGRTDLVTEIDDAMSSWQQGVSDEDDELLDERLEAVERVLEAERMADPDYRPNPGRRARRYSLVRHERKARQGR